MREENPNDFMRQEHWHVHRYLFVQLGALHWKLDVRLLGLVVEKTAAMPIQITLHILPVLARGAESAKSSGEVAS